MSRQQKRAVWIRSLTATIGVALALAQGAPIGSEAPKLHGQTLDGKAIVLPDAAAGKVTLMVFGASKKGGERTGPWKDHFAADFGLNPNASYYVAALLQAVPAPFRGIIRSGMRGGTPAAGQSHVLTSASDEAAWKKYLEIRDDTLPSVLLLDDHGRACWSYNGVFDVNRYQALKEAAEALLRGR